MDWINDIKARYRWVHETLEESTTGYQSYHPIRIGAHLLAAVIDFGWWWFLDVLDGIEIVSTDSPLEHPIRFGYGIVLLLLSPIVIPAAIFSSSMGGLLALFVFFLYLFAWAPFFVGAKALGWDFGRPDIEPYDPEVPYREMFADRQLQYELGFKRILVENARAINVHSTRNEYKQVVFRLLGGGVIIVFGTIAYSIGIWFLMGAGGILLQLGALVFPLETGQILPPESADFIVALPVIGSALYFLAIYSSELTDR